MSTYNDDILQVFNEQLPFEKLSGCNILVTGATGLIGGCLVESLMMNPHRDYSVYALGRNVKRAKKRFDSFANEKNFFFIKHDVLNPLKSDICFDFIIHAASGASPNEYTKRPVEVIKSNIDGVVNLMEYGLKHGMQRFLYLSSCEVYGEVDESILKENHSGYVDCMSPRSCYPSSKRTAETLCVSYASEYNADVVIARPCHVYGPCFTESDNRVYAQFIRNVLHNEDIVMKSTGTQFRSWCYVVDCVSAILYLLLKGESGQAYNIADVESTISIRQLAETIAKIGNKKVIIDLPNDEEKRGFNVVTRSVVSTVKLESLGWKSRTDIVEGLLKTIEKEKLYQKPA